jgi:hypothetical protein
VNFIRAEVCIFYIFFSVALQVRVQAIRGLPLFCKDTPENIGKMVDILVQILGSGKLVVVWFTKILHILRIWYPF